MIRLERVVAALPAGFETLLAEARAAGHTMLDTLADEWMSGANRFDRSGEILLAAYIDDSLAGIGGLTREPRIPGAFRMRRFFVRPGYRRVGVGRVLADALLAESRRSGCTVNANAAAGSEAFWEALGFTPGRRNGRTHTLNG